MDPGKNSGSWSTDYVFYKGLGAVGGVDDTILILKTLIESTKMSDEQR